MLIDLNRNRAVMRPSCNDRKNGAQAGGGSLFNLIPFAAEEQEAPLELFGMQLEDYPLEPIT